jgi:hypothetical protein
LIERALHALDIERFELDPASNPGSIVPADVSLVDPSRESEFGELPAGFYYQDGLALDWATEEVQTAWSNPPYHRSVNGTWAAKLGEQGSAGVRIVALVPVATSEKWWGPYWRADQLGLLVGRVKHLGEAHSATFAQAVVGWNVSAARFEEAFGQIARIR